jgi:hypothetical protein
VLIDLVITSLHHHPTTIAWKLWWCCAARRSASCPAQLIALRGCARHLVLPQPLRG